MSKLQVIDIFCGAGGFSEGFRQVGYEIILGIDRYQPAVDTFNFNFGLNCSVGNVLEFERSYRKIEELPDSEIIVGSPPCVSFSNSNKSGKADKSMGLRLIETFFRIIAVKKFKSGTILKAWAMENVPKSRRYLKKEYSFKDLHLTRWAKLNGIDPDQVAIDLSGKHHILNSAEYGSPQNRKRLITAEVVGKPSFEKPERTHRHPDENSDLPRFRTLGSVKRSLPRPNCKKSDRPVKDPNYLNVVVSLAKLTDHFYDSGLYNSQWRSSRFYKVNHPYMGKMSFPENEQNPSRTITATNIGTSRESIIYRSEYDRKGDGEYRGPTVREGACLMSFPITYQFLGKESAKWRLVGNAVCPSVSRAIAKEFLIRFGHEVPVEYEVMDLPGISEIENLNTFKEKVFDSPPRRNSGSRFRRHAVKKDNITITLTNYDIEDRSKRIWQTSIFYGIGEGFRTQKMPDGFYEKLNDLISMVPKGKVFLEKINNGFSEKIADGNTLQMMYEDQSSKSPYLEPTELLEELEEKIEELGIRSNYVDVSDLNFFKRKRISAIHLLAAFAINKITSKANSTDYGS